MSKQRAKGTRGENEVRDYLREWFPEVEREDFSSPLGDLKGTPATIEVKSRATIEPSTFLAQVNRADAKTGRGMPVVVCKRPRRPIAEAFAFTDLQHMARLLRAYQICLEKGLL